MGIVVQYISRLLKPSNNDMSNDDSIFVGFTKEDVRIAFLKRKIFHFWFSWMNFHALMETLLPVDFPVSMLSDVHCIYLKNGNYL